MARPEGSIVTVDSIVSKELLSWLKLHPRIRKMIETQVAEFEKTIEGGGTNLDGQLKILSGLQTIVQTSTKIVDSLIKALNNDDQKPSDDKGISEAELFKELGQI